MKIELILLGVIGLVFLVDFIMNSRKKPSIDNVVDQIEGGEPVKTNNPLNYLLKRKKNFTLFIISIPLIKVFFHYMFYPVMTKDILRMGKGRRGWSGYVPTEFSQSYKKSFGDHLDLMFTGELWLFIPATLIMIFITWYFNDKIKAR